MTLASSSGTYSSQRSSEASEVPMEPPKRMSPWGLSTSAEMREMSSPAPAETTSTEMPVCSSNGGISMEISSSECGV